MKSIFNCGARLSAICRNGFVAVIGYVVLGTFSTALPEVTIESRPFFKGEVYNVDSDGNIYMKDVVSDIDDLGATDRVIVNLKGGKFNAEILNIMVFGRDLTCHPDGFNGEALISDCFLLVGDLSMKDAVLTADMVTYVYRRIVGTN